MVVYSGNTSAAETFVGTWVSPVANASMLVASMFCAATSVLMAAASPGRAAFSAVMKGKMVV